MPSPTLLPPLGLLGVQVPFTRPAGDAANPATWPFPLIREEIPGTTLDVIVNTSYTPEFIDDIVASAQRLVDQGCVGIITDCGFLGMLQAQLAERISVPLASSALCQLPSILGWVPRSKGVGVVTFDGGKLGAGHLKGVGVREEDLERLWTTGVPEGGVLRGIVQGAMHQFDLAGVEQEMVKVVKELVQRKPEIGAILLECTQMAPFACAVQTAVGLPVYDVYTLGVSFYGGLVRRRPEYWGAADGTGPYT
jgi:hypothetical protein